MKRGIDLKWVHPQELVSGKNPRNWKTHPDRQKRAVSAIIKRNGWARPLLWNLKTKRLIDGHGRLEIAIDEGWEEVPVIMGSWSETQEKELLASLDTTPDMAQIDAKALDSLTRDIAKTVEEIVGKDNTADEIMKTAIDLNAFAETIQPRSPVIRRRGAKRRIGKERIKVPTVRKQRREPYREVMEQRTEEDSIVYSSSNGWGFPDIPLKSCYSDLNGLPESTWDGTEGGFNPFCWIGWGLAPFREKQEGGILHFYTDDWRFNRIYKMSETYVDKFAAWEFLAVCEPDYSTYSDWPLVARMWNVYRSRWVARFFAEKCRLKVIPLIRRTDDVIRDVWLYDTLPNAPIMAVNAGQSHMGKRDDTGVILKNSITAAIKGKNVKAIIVNSGVEHRKHIEGWLPKGPRYIFVESTPTARRRYIDSLSLKKRKV